MPRVANPPTALIVLAALGLGVTGITAVSARSTNDGSMRCEIQVKEQNSGVALDGVVYASTKMVGEYHLRVSKSGGGGSANIDQTGDFSAAPGAPGRLGTVMLGTNGGSYDAKLTVTAGGRSVDCTEKVRGSL
jgi:hypothetical protein